MKLSLPHIHQKQKSHEMDSMRVLHAKLSQNALTEFKIGFDEDECRAKHEIKALIRAAQHQYLHKLATDKYSCLESIKIGWKLPRFALGPILQQVCPSLLEKPANVQHLQLILDAWIPESTLKQLVSCHSLKTLDLRSTRIRTRCMSDPSHDRLSPQETVGVVEDNIVRIVPHISTSIETLKLIDCDLLTYHIPELCEMLRKQRHVRHLSLRQNRYLEGGWKCLFRLPFLKTLDISICDLNASDGFCIAQAIEKNHFLSRLSLAGNYRLPMAIPKLVQASATHLVELDISFCDVQNKVKKDVFDILATTPNCTIRSLKMQGSRQTNIDALINCIRHNTSLNRLILDHPRDQFPVSSDDLKEVLDALQYNYYLQMIILDTLPQDQSTLAKMDFWLQLNSCGRSIVLQDCNNHQSFGKSWPQVLGQAAFMGDINILFWLIKHGAELF